MQAGTWSPDIGDEIIARRKGHQYKSIGKRTPEGDSRGGGKIHPNYNPIGLGKKRGHFLEK